MEKRFRKTRAGKAADVWVEFGALRYTAELYENGQFVKRCSGRRSRSEETEVFLSGDEFAALVRIHPDATIRCTWSR